MKEFPECKISLKRMEGHKGPLTCGNCEVFFNGEVSKLPIRKISFEFGDNRETALVKVEFMATEIELEGVKIQAEAKPSNWSDNETKQKPEDK